MTTGVDVYDEWSMILNGLYDPANTSTSNRQPLYFDQWAAIYTNYMVRGCRVKYVLMNANDITGTGRQGHLAYGNIVLPNPSSLPDITTGTASSVAGLIARADCWKIRQQSSTGGAVINSDKSQICKKYYSMKKVIGRPLDPAIDGATVGSNPSNPVVSYFFQCSTVAPAAADCTHIWAVELKFYCEFWGPKVVSN